MASVLAYRLIFPNVREQGMSAALIVALRDSVGYLRDDGYHQTAQLMLMAAEEIDHRDLGLAHGAAEAPAYPLLTGAIKAGSRLAIWLAERI